MGSISDLFLQQVDERIKLGDKHVNYRELEWLQPGHSHRCTWYLRCQPPHGFFLAPPHLRGPGTAASSQGAVSGLRLRQREPLSIWT